MTWPPQKPSHLNSPVAHHRPESSEGPMRLWATVAVGVLFMLFLVVLVIVLRRLGGGEETVESLRPLWVLM